MTSAPARSSSRVARRTFSTPSTTVTGCSGSSARSATPIGMRVSPWPPVCESAPTAMRIRGPGTMPWSIAICIPRGAPPASRTEVKPCSSVSFAFWNASAATKLYGFKRRCWMLDGPNQRWMWQSIIPGITVSADASITVAPRGTSFAIAVMVSPSTTMTAPRTGSFPLPSMSAPVRIAVVMRWLAGIAAAPRARCARSSRDRTARACRR